MTRKIPAPGHAPLVVSTFHQGHLTYEQRFIDCGKKNCSSCTHSTGRVASHGPYWYLCVPINGKWFRIYIGKILDTHKYILANGEIDWKTIKAKRERGKAGKRDTKNTPGTAGVPPASTPGVLPATTRGPAHVAQLEHQSKAGSNGVPPASTPGVPPATARGPAHIAQLEHQARSEPNPEQDGGREAQTEREKPSLTSTEQSLTDPR